MQWKIFDSAPTSLALCYHRASPASFCCSCDFSPHSVPSYVVFVPFAAFICDFDSWLTDILRLFISLSVGVELLYIAVRVCVCVFVANVALAVASGRYADADAGDGSS